MSIGITDEMLSMMRGQVEELLPDTAIIQSVIDASDGAGGQSSTWTAVTGGTVLCRIDPSARAADLVSDQVGRETLEHIYQLTVPYNAPIAPHYRVAIGGENYEIVQLTENHSWRVSRRATIKRVD